MEANKEDLEPIEPNTARELYLDHKATIVPRQPSKVTTIEPDSIPYNYNQCR